VNFTTLGFGDIVAVNRIARIMVTLEVVLGYVMLGGLISIFANRFARRKLVKEGIEMQYRPNTGLLYGRVRHTGVVLVIMLAMVSAVVAEESARQYVGSQRYDKLHVLTCKWALKLKARNAVYLLNTIIHTSTISEGIGRM